MLLNTLILTTIITLVASTSTASDSKANGFVVKNKAVAVKNAKTAPKAKSAILKTVSKAKTVVGKTAGKAKAVVGKTTAGKTKAVPKAKTVSKPCKPGQQPSKGTCSACPKNTFSTAGVKCLKSTDIYSTTVNPTLGTPLTCSKSYGIAEGKCSPKYFARYLGYNLNGQDIKVTGDVATETACRKTCLGTVTPSGAFQGFNYWGASGCFCKNLASIAPENFTPTIDGIVSLVGTCGTYRSALPSLVCQDVSYTVAGCFNRANKRCAIPVSVGCTDPNAQLCGQDTLDAAITCKTGFFVNNKKCSPNP